MKNVILFLFLISFFVQSVKSQGRKPYLAIDRQIESYLLQKYSKNYLVAVDPFDTLLVVVRNAVKDEEFLDPYGTLKGKMFFEAWQTDEDDMSIPEAKEIFGFSVNGTVLWDSGPLCTSGGAYVLGSSDINNDGEVDVLVSVRNPDQDINYLSYLWIFSWNGTSARILNDVNSQTGQSVLLSGGDWYQLFDLKGDGIDEIWALWDKDNPLFPDTLMSTRPYVTYSYNGSLYGLWPNTVQVPSTTMLPANRLTVKPSCSVTYDGSSYTYSYKWSNDSTSKQKIRFIFLQDVDQEAIMTSPRGWLAALPTKPFSAVLWELQDSQKRQMINIGQSGEGFGLRATCLPAIVRYFVKGYAPSDTYWGDEPMPSDAEVLHDFLTNSVIGYTIGPKLFSFDPLNFLDTLTSYVLQSRSLGWIKDQSIANKYLGYIVAARSELQGNNVYAAKQTLQTIAANTVSDSATNMTRESYALLRFNADYLNAHLTAQSIPFMYQLDAVIAAIAQSQTAGDIGDTAFVNSLNKQLSSARKNVGNGKVAQSITLINNVLSRIEKAYDNTATRQQQGKPLPKSFVTQSGWTALSQQINQLLQNLQSIGTTINVPGQFSTIQAAIKAAEPGTTITVEAGTYNELLTINNEDSLTLLAMDNVTIRGVHIARSSVITIKGFTIDASTTNKDAVQIEGADNSDIAIEANQIQNSAGNGITLGKNNSGTRIINNVIVNNQKNGIDCSNGTSGTQYIVNNTIVDNGYNGLEAASQADLYIVNNIISYNGTAGGTSGGRYGVKRNANTSATAITLLNNLIIGNNGEVSKKNSRDLSNFAQVLDGTDAQNITTLGTEGTGVVGSLAAQQADVMQADFRLTSSSIAIGRGTTNFLMVPDEDKDGNPRVRGGTIDLGAYEEE